MAQGELAFARCEAGDPEQCQSLLNGNQCTNRKVSTSNFCACHGGNKAAQAEAKNAAYRYRASIFAAEIAENATEDRIKCLHEELGVLRKILQEKLIACKGTTDLIIQAGPITNLVNNIQKLVEAIHGLDKDLGTLMDKQALLGYAEQIVTIIKEEVADESTRLRVASKIAALFMEKK